MTTPDDAWERLMTEGQEREAARRASVRRTRMDKACGVVCGLAFFMVFGSCVMLQRTNDDRWLLAGFLAWATLFVAACIAEPNA